MYIPNHYRDLTDPDAYTFMMAYPFGLAVTTRDGAPFISHVPFLVEPAYGRVRFHLARANPHGDTLAGGDATLVFHGPHAYVSPRWHAASTVPTWNYVAVHVRGPVRELPAVDTAAVVAALSRQYEGPDGLGDYEHSDAYRRLLGAIRGFELNVTSVHAKRKLSQNRSREDQARIAAELAASPDSAARDTAALMAANVAAAARD